MAKNEVFQDKQCLLSRIEEANRSFGSDTCLFLSNSELAKYRTVLCKFKSCKFQLWFLPQPQDDWCPDEPKLKLDRSINCWHSIEAHSSTDLKKFASDG